jgi:hypothetical protein
MQRTKPDERVDGPVPTKAAPSPRVSQAVAVRCPSLRYRSLQCSTGAYGIYATLALGSALALFRIR